MWNSFSRLRTVIVKKISSTVDFIDDMFLYLYSSNELPLHTALKESCRNGNIELLNQVKKGDYCAVGLGSAFLHTWLPDLESYLFREQRKEVVNQFIITSCMPDLPMPTDFDIRYNPLFLAVSANQVDIVKSLLDYDSNAAKEHISSSKHYKSDLIAEAIKIAIKSGHVAILQFLLIYKVKINAEMLNAAAKNPIIFKILLADCCVNSDINNYSDMSEQFQNTLKNIASDLSLQRDALYLLVRFNRIEALESVIANANNEVKKLIIDEFYNWFYFPHHNMQHSDGTLVEKLSNIQEDFNKSYHMNMNITLNKTEEERLSSIYNDGSNYRNPALKDVAIVKQHIEKLNIDAYPNLKTTVLIACSKNLLNYAFETNNPVLIKESLTSLISYSSKIELDDILKESVIRALYADNVGVANMLLEQYPHLTRNIEFLYCLVELTSGRYEIYLPFLQKMFSMYDSACAKQDSPYDFSKLLTNSYIRPKMLKVLLQKSTPFTKHDNVGAILDQLRKHIRANDVSIVEYYLSCKPLQQFLYIDLLRHANTSSFAQYFLLKDPVIFKGFMDDMQQGNLADLKTCYGALSASNSAKDIASIEHLPTNHRLICLLLLIKPLMRQVNKAAKAKKTLYMAEFIKLIEHVDSPDMFFNSDYLAIMSYVFEHNMVDILCVEDNMKNVITKSLLLMGSFSDKVVKLYSTILEVKEQTLQAILLAILFEMPEADYFIRALLQSDKFTQGLAENIAIFEDQIFLYLKSKTDEPLLDKCRLVYNCTKKLQAFYDNNLNSEYPEDIIKFISTFGHSYSRMFLDQHQKDFLERWQAKMPVAPYPNFVLELDESMIEPSEQMHQNYGYDMYLKSMDKRNSEEEELATLSIYRKRVSIS